MDIQVGFLQVDGYITPIISWIEIKINLHKLRKKVINVNWNQIGAWIKSLKTHMHITHYDPNFEFSVIISI
jgi:hypothetical protein